MTEVSSITPAEFTERWSADDEDVVLLDVREYPEVAVAAIAFARHIPMGQIANRLAEIEPSKSVVVMCHGGLRSMQVATFLAGRGYQNVFNLAGGIDAWSREVDSTIPRY